MRWDFYSKRKRVTLQSFLSDCIDMKSAIEKFSRLGLEPPSADSISEALVKPEAPEPLKTAEKIQEVKRSRQDSRKTTTSRSSSSRRKSSKAASTKTAKTTRTRRKATPKKKEEPVQEASQEQTAEAKDEKKQYFRKIIKPEKK